MTNTNDSKELALTVDEAVKYIRASRNRTIFLSVNQNALIEGDEEHVFPAYGHIKVSAPAAVQFVKDTYEALLKLKPTARIRISILNSCMFIG